MTENQPKVEYRGPYIIREENDALGRRLRVTRIAKGKRWESARILDDHEECAIDHRELVIERAMTDCEHAMFRESGRRFPFLPVLEADTSSLLDWLEQFTLPCVAFPDGVGAKCAIIDRERRLMLTIDCAPETGRMLASLLNSLPVLLLVRE